MSWTAQRRTTRVEDEAYCLMGLFDVDMPLIYGEGRKAFSRLQQEILDRSQDQSIFAWAYPEDQHSHMTMTGLFAPLVECFKSLSAVENLEQLLETEYEIPFEVIGRLLRIRLRALSRVDAILL